jgi:formamidase
MASRQCASNSQSGLPTYTNYNSVPFCGTIKNNETVKIECVDWTGGQIKNTDDADDIKNVDLTRVHYLTGPFEIEEAEPGDVLIVDIQDVQPMEDHLWGFTGIFDKDNGGGFLDEIYPKAAKAIWDFEGIFCSSRQYGFFTSIVELRTF